LFLLDEADREGDCAQTLAAVEVENKCGVPSVFSVSYRNTYAFFNVFFFSVFFNTIIFLILFSVPRTRGRTGYEAPTPL
jgi:hypothetical protein